MDRLVTILRAAHCRSTHHYFAIDALEHIATAGGNRLGNLLLKYHDEYLVGAKAPDKSFRDFQNHVLHVEDNHWGGAPRACEKWLAQTIEYLDARKWKKAAYACGVLSHYFTDPFMPLHTAQSERESIVHRPMEWSVCKAYEEIAAMETSNVTPIGLAPGGQWISGAVTAGAQRANTYYRTLIDDYDLQKGCRQPPEGLPQHSRKILAELFYLTTTTWAKSLARIADSTTSDIPEFSLSLTTLLATIDMPLAWVVRRISDYSEQRAVQAVLREYESTGIVRKNLPAEVTRVALQKQKDLLSSKAAPDTRTQPRPVSGHAPAVLPEASAAPVERQHETPEKQPAPEQSTERQDSADRAAASGSRSSRERVTRESDLVDAPSIGPKTARRFEKIGIQTIGQFLDAAASDMRSDLDTRWITENLLVQWQEQAQLVCDVPQLCGYKAQLLVEAGCHDAASLAASTPSELFGRVDAVCHSIDGQRILRSSTPPKQSDIAQWIAAAQMTSDNDRGQTDRSQAA
ncbi:MAG: DUF4332 domain-containing protein [Aureliella sp.]